MRPYRLAAAVPSRTTDTAESVCSTSICRCDSALSERRAHRLAQCACADRRSPVHSQAPSPIVPEHAGHLVLRRPRRPRHMRCFHPAKPTQGQPRHRQPEASGVATAILDIVTRCPALRIGFDASPHRTHLGNHTAFSDGTQADISLDQTQRGFLHQIRGVGPCADGELRKLRLLLRREPALPCSQDTGKRALTQFLDYKAYRAFNCSGSTAYPSGGGYSETSSSSRRRRYRLAICRGPVSTSMSQHVPCK